MTDESWAVVRLASNWRDGRLPETGGVLDQAAWTSAAVEVVLGTWAKMRDARDRKNKD